MWVGRLLASLWRTEGGEVAAPEPAQVHAAASTSAPSSGLRLQAVDEILESNRELVGRIKLCYGCGTDSFNNDLLAPIRQYVQYVNQLPATMDSYFTGPGGLARIGLETAFFALQATDAQIFAGRATISNRRLLEPRWRRATFIAGLCNELHRTLSHIRVADAKGREWQPYLMPLSCWAAEKGVSSANVRWQAAQETRALGLFALPMIVPAETMCDLTKDNATIVPHMLACIAGATMYHEHSVMYRLVRHAAALVIHRNLRDNDGYRAGRPALHMARYMVEAMRELVLSHHGWQPNIGRSRLWYGQDGLFLVWPNGINDVVKLLEDEGLPGIPDTASGVLDILEAADLVRAQSGDCRVWTIYPPGAAEPLEAIRFAAPFTLLGVITPRAAPLPMQLTAKREAGEPAAPPPPERPDQSIPAEHSSNQDDTPGTNHGAQSRATKQRRQPIQLTLPEMDETPELSGPGDTQESKQMAMAPTAPGHGKRQRTQDDKAKKGRATFSAPMRLNPEVATALAEIVGTLAGPPPAACQLDGAVLFVPLGELARRGIDARRAQRALGDAGMLAPQPDGERIHTREVLGAKVPGLLIDASCVSGWQAEKAPLEAQDGGNDAATPL
jgi:conjugal transfer pilus assembly protein TraI